MMYRIELYCWEIWGYATLAYFELAFSGMAGGKHEKTRNRMEYPKGHVSNIKQSLTGQISS